VREAETGREREGKRGEGEEEGSTRLIHRFQFGSCRIHLQCSARCQPD